MGFNSDSADNVLGPVTSDSVLKQVLDPARYEQGLVGTGATPSVNSIALPVGHWATVSNDPGVDIYFVTSDNNTTPPSPNDASHKWRSLQGGGEFNYLVEPFTQYVWVYAVDGSSAYSAGVGMSSQ